jgi:hypothetical protein
MKKCFVFGSNLAGIHGAGSAREARLNWGAEMGIGFGPTGNAYAIPTKDRNIERMELCEIEGHVRHFIDYARANPDTQFCVVAIGCGLAGYRPDQIGPMFHDAPGNCILPRDFEPYC